MKHMVCDFLFTNSDGMPDETQFDFNGDWNDVMETWTTFCDENDHDFGRIEGIAVYEIDEPGYEG